MGAAIEELFGRTGRNLRSVLRFVLWDDDYNACINYLNGDPVAGARYELKASIHWYNDEESRIEKVMRDLTPEQRARLGDTEMGRDAVADTRSALGGTDLDVFNALMVGNDARADAYQMRDKLQEAREKGDVDAINAVLAEYSKAPQNWAGRNLTADERRQQVQREFAAVLDNVAADKPAAVISQKDAEDRVLKVALADMQVVRDRGDQPELVTVKVEGAQRDLGEALVRKGEASLDARVARLGVEIQRPGKPNVTNLETALIDPRLNPNNRSVSPQDIQQALKERQQMFEQFGQRYLPADREPRSEDRAATHGGGVPRSLWRRASQGRSRQRLDQGDPPQPRHRRPCNARRDQRTRHRRGARVPHRRAHEPRRDRADAPSLPGTDHRQGRPGGSRPVGRSPACSATSATGSTSSRATKRSSSKSSCSASRATTRSAPKSRSSRRSSR